MQSLQEVIVNEHINDLRREAESLRMEQRIRHRTRDGDGARVRLGHLLIGIGLALSGSAGDASGETVRRTA